MYGFSKIILEYTVQCAAERMQSESRVMECVQAIRRYLGWIAQEWPTGNYYRDLRDTVNELSDIAFQHSEFLIASRLQFIAWQLEECDAKSVEEAS